MRFLLLNQFYPPDPAPTGWYLQGLARVLAQRGHGVKVLCSRRSYDGATEYPRHEEVGGVKVCRLRATGFGRRGFAGKMADYGSFYASLLAALTLERIPPDVILSLTTPPYVGLLGKIAAWRHGCRHAHWLMDLYPDVMFAHGIGRTTGVASRVLQWLTRFQLRGASTVVSLGPMMAERVAAYLEESAQNLPDGGWLPGGSGKGPGGSDRLDTFVSPSAAGHWLPLWCDPELAPWPENERNPLRTERGWQAQDLVLMYSGNMGLGHRLGEFLEAARCLGPSGPRWVFSGGGKRRADVKAFMESHPGARVELLNYVPAERLNAHLCAADVHLASLDGAWQGLMVPSKLQASFAVGRPVIFVGRRQNETASWIEQSGGGWVVGEDDVQGLVRAIDEARDGAERQRRGAAARQFAVQNFQMSRNCAKLADLLDTAPPCYNRLLSTVARGGKEAGIEASGRRSENRCG